MKTSGLLIVGAIFLGSLGCNGLVVDPIDSNSPEGESEPDVPNAIVMPMSKWQASPGSNAEIAPFAFEGTSPDDLVIFIANRQQNCNDPILVPADLPSAEASECNNDTAWQIGLVLPQGLAAPGVIDLESDLSDAIRIHWSAFSNCSGGWALTTSMPGTLEISSLDASSVVMDLSGELPYVSSSGPTPDPSGEYTATYCP